MTLEENKATDIIDNPSDKIDVLDEEEGSDKLKEDVTTNLKTIGGMLEIVYSERKLLEGPDWNLNNVKEKVNFFGETVIEPFSLDLGWDDVNLGAFSLLRYFGESINEQIISIEENPLVSERKDKLLSSTVTLDTIRQLNEALTEDEDKILLLKELSWLGLDNKHFLMLAIYMWLQGWTILFKTPGWDIQVPYIKTKSSEWKSWESYVVVFQNGELYRWNDEIAASREFVADNIAGPTIDSEFTNNTPWERNLSGNISGDIIIGNVTINPTVWVTRSEELSIDDKKEQREEHEQYQRALFGKDEQWNSSPYTLRDLTPTTEQKNKTGISAGADFLLPVWEDSKCKINFGSDFNNLEINGVPLSKIHLSFENGWLFYNSEDWNNSYVNIWYGYANRTLPDEEENRSNIHQVMVNGSYWWKVNATINYSTRQTPSPNGEETYIRTVNEFSASVLTNISNDITANATVLLSDNSTNLGLSAQYGNEETPLYAVWSFNMTNTNKDEMNNSSYKGNVSATYKWDNFGVSWTGMLQQTKGVSTEGASTKTVTSLDLRGEYGNEETPLNFGWSFNMTNTNQNGINNSSYGGNASVRASVWNDFKVFGNAWYNQTNMAESGATKLTTVNIWTQYGGEESPLYAMWSIWFENTREFGQNTPIFLRTLWGKILTWPLNLNWTVSYRTKQWVEVQAWLWYIVNLGGDQRININGTGNYSKGSGFSGGLTILGTFRSP